MPRPACAPVCPARQGGQLLAQPDDLTDHDYGGRSDALLGGVHSYFLQGGN
jgi:hypothetical protein